MATILKLVSPRTGEVSYRVQVRAKGQYSSATFDRKRDAEDFAAKTEGKITEDQHFPERRARRTTLAEVIERYKIERLPDLRAQQTMNSKLKWWLAKLGDRPLSTITSDAISESLAELARTGSRTKAEQYRSASNQKRGKRGRGRRGQRAASPATLNRYRDVLSIVLGIAAKEWKLIPSNPCANVKRRKEPKGRTRWLSDDERSRLLAACRDHEASYLYPLALLALTTGARRGELLRLRWSDIDFAAGRATFFETKNGDTRSAPLVSTVQPALKEYRKALPARCAWLFPLDETCQQPRYWIDDWDEALKAAEITDFRFHDLRHTAASYLAQSGASLLEIKEVLGHRTLSMVARYSHLCRSRTADTVTKAMQERGL